MPKTQKVVLVRTRAGSEHFWEISQKGRELTTRQGKRGSKRRVSKTKLRDWFFASHELEQRVARKRAQGYRKPGRATVDPLEDDIVEAIDAAQVRGWLELARLDWMYGGSQLHGFSDGGGSWGLVLQVFTYPSPPRAGVGPMIASP